MSKVPADATPRELGKVLTKKGFRLTRQGANHTIFERGEGREKTVIPVPRHGTIKRGLLQGILSDAGITVDEFNELK